MGQAKRRGTLEERIAQAQMRTDLVDKTAREEPQSPIGQAVRRYGALRVGQYLQRQNLITYQPKETSHA